MLERFKLVEMSLTFPDIVPWEKAEENVNDIKSNVIKNFKLIRFDK